VWSRGAAHMPLDRIQAVDIILSDLIPRGWDSPSRSDPAAGAVRPPTSGTITKVKIEHPVNASPFGSSAPHVDPSATED
jgi:hypothetical protein